MARGTEEALNRTKRLFAIHSNNLREKIKAKNPDVFDKMIDEDARVVSNGLSIILGFDASRQALTLAEYLGAIKMLRQYGDITGNGEHVEGSISILERQEGRNKYFASRAA